MKRSTLLMGGLLAASLACQGAQAGVSPAKSKERGAKARVSQPVKTLRHQARSANTVRPARVAPAGLALALSADISAPPATLAITPAATLPVPPAVSNPYLSASVPAMADARANPYLPGRIGSTPAQAFAPIQAEPDFKARDGGRPGVGSLFGALGQAIPLLPDSGQSVLPSIKKVYPTGEKPLVVVSFKCPTEALGVTPPTIRLLHNLVDLGMDGLNKTDLLSFNLQQVCQ